MAFQEKLSAAGNGTLFRDALFSTGRSAVSLLLLFVIPLLVINLASLIFSVGLAGGDGTNAGGFFHNSTGEGFNLHLNGLDNRTIHVNGKDVRITTNRAGNPVVTGLPLDKPLEVEVSRQLHVNLSNGRSAWLIGSTLSYSKPISFQAVNPAPRTLYIYRNSRYSYTTNRIKLRSQPVKQGWDALSLPRRKPLLRFNATAVSRLSPQAAREAWLIGDRFTYAAPAATPPTLQRILALVGSLLLNTLLLLGLFCWALISYFNRPPIYFREIRELISYNLINFFGTLLIFVIINLLTLSAFAVFPPLLLVSVYLLMRLSLAPAATITEGLSPLRAISRSFQLTRGINLRLLFPVAGIIILMIFLSTIALALTANLLGIAHNQLPLHLMLASGQQVYLWPKALLIFYPLFLGMAALVVPVFVRFFYNLYMDARIRHEDLEGKEKSGFFTSSRL